MMNRDFFPNVTEEFDERVRQTLAALPEKRRRRMTAGKVAAIALAAALCLGGTALAASGGLFPLLFPDGGDAISGYAATPATPVAENEDWRLTVDSVLLDENSLTGVVSLRLENLKGDGKMPFKIANLFPEYQNQPGALVDRAPARDLANRLVKQLNISTPSIHTPVRKLSGGNVQKVLLGREIASNPRILITAYPVRGLDINSSMTIYRMLNEQKQKGVAVLYIGEDLDVLLELCDRIMVLCGGRVTGIVDAQAVTKEQLGLMMTGASMEEAMQNG